MEYVTSMTSREIEAHWQNDLERSKKAQEIIRGDLRYTLTVYGLVFDINMPPLAAWFYTRQYQVLI